MSSIVNKVKEVIHDHKHSDAEGTHGPHSSRAANAADPRVDSDRDGSKTIGTGTGTTGHTTGVTGTHKGEYASNDHHTFGSGPAPNTDGPHRTDALNKVDPRVDSDRDGSTTLGGNNNFGTTGTTGTGFTGTTGTHNTGFTGSHAEGTHGPHGSRLANAADPRVDSDRDGSTTLGGGRGTTGTTMGQGTLGHAAGHVGAAVGGTHGTGPAPNTAGPHKQDMLNKADPRVDSDLDGSKTVGRDQTFAQS